MISLSQFNHFGDAMIVNFAWISNQWNGEMKWIINIFIFFNVNLLISHRRLASVYSTAWDFLSWIWIRRKPVSNLIHFMWFFVLSVSWMLHVSHCSSISFLWDYFGDSAACTRTPWYFDRVWHWNGIKSYGFSRIDYQFRPNRNLRFAQRVSSK